MKTNKDIIEELKTKKTTHIYAAILKNSVLKWLDKLNENETYIIKLEEQKEQNSNYKYKFENHLDVLFYNVNEKNRYLGEQTINSINNTLLPLEIVFKIDDKTLQINPALVNFYKSKIKENSELKPLQVLKEFIVQNFKRYVQKYFINTLSKKDVKKRQKISSWFLSKRYLCDRSR
ncbi:hypothetical protein [Mycoplasmopsis bovigenitalium]|uniref:hypothetical protein n=1 Tax=Mycoplasmopsis bovigenitalium TaxID=2112 RepID=UPI000BBB0840|nr:hypothetical protein [Mycoplasmopsis bovigenitalium]